MFFKHRAQRSKCTGVLNLKYLFFETFLSLCKLFCKLIFFFLLHSSAANFPLGTAQHSVSPPSGFFPGEGAGPSFHRSSPPATLVFVPSSSASGGYTTNNASLQSFPSTNNPSQVENEKPIKRKRREWTETETTLLWESYEDAYMNGKITSKTSKNNNEGWGIVLKEFNKQLSMCNIPPRTLQQAKEKINNLKTEHKKIKDKESHTGEETQAKPYWYEMVDRVQGGRDEIDPPYLFDNNKKKSSSISKRPAEEDEDECEMENPDSPASNSSTSTISNKGKNGKISKKRQQKKDQEDTESSERKEFLKVLQRQVDLLEKGQERDDKMMSRLVDLEEKAEERQKEILMAIINKL